MAGSAITRTRFAPSPTGYLHLGHAHAALTAAAHASDGKFLLRIEDIDRDRCRPEYDEAILEDLSWLGLGWPRPVMRQSDRMPAYRAALARLAPLTYPCCCRRGDIRAALSAPQEGVPRAGPDGLVYPGTCRYRPMSDARDGDVIRLDVQHAFRALGMIDLVFRERSERPEALHSLSAAAFGETIGDVILSRRGMGTSYHLAVVVDDAEQRITLVTRGKDLFDATWIHVLLQRLLDYPTPDYLHHRLIRDARGHRLAKRDDARALRQFRTEGVTPAQIRAMLVA